MCRGRRLDYRAFDVESWPVGMEAFSFIHQRCMIDHVLPWWVCGESRIPAAFFNPCSARVEFHEGSFKRATLFSHSDGKSKEAFNYVIRSCKLAVV